MIVDKLEYTTLSTVQLTEYFKVVGTSPHGAISTKTADGDGRKGESDRKHEA